MGVLVPLFDRLPKCAPLLLQTELILVARPRLGGCSKESTTSWLFHIEYKSLSKKCAPATNKAKSPERNVAKLMATKATMKLLGWTRFCQQYVYTTENVNVHKASWVWTISLIKPWRVGCKMPEDDKRVSKENGSSPMDSCWNKRSQVSIYFSSLITLQWDKSKFYRAIFP